jgi:hypothetical protein
MPLGAKVIRILLDIACAFALFLFLAPIFLMIAHRIEVQRAEKRWQETIEQENAKTEKAVKAWRDAVERARVK